MGGLWARSCEIYRDLVGEFGRVLAGDLLLEPQGSAPGAALPWQELLDRIEAAAEPDAVTERDALAGAVLTALDFAESFVRVSIDVG